MNRSRRFALPASPGAGGQSLSVPRGQEHVPARARAIIAALAVTQTVGYGTLYYSFAVFLAPVAKELDVSRTSVTGAFTAAVLATAALAIPVGRWLDRHGSRWLMTTGSAAGSLLLVAFAQVNSLTAMYVVWTGIGAISAMVLYESAFATIIAWHPPGRRAGALLAVTIVAGFASSIYLPLTAALVEHLGWRSTALTLALVHAVTTIPLHAFVIRRPPSLVRAPHLPSTSRIPRPPGTPGVKPADQHRDIDISGVDNRRSIVRATVQDRRFWLLASAFTAQAVAISTMTIHLIGILTEAGHPATFAATITGGLGVLSVTGRVVVTALSRRTSVASVTAVTFAVQSTAALALIVVAGDAAGAIVGVLLFGIGFGVATIARPTLVSATVGERAYASVAGMIAAPVTLTTATAPLIAAQIRHLTGTYTPVLLTVAVSCATSATAVFVAGRHLPAGRRLDG